MNINIEIDTQHALLNKTNYYRVIFWWNERL